MSAPRSFERSETSRPRQRKARVLLDEAMADWLEALVADERYELVGELHEALDEHGKESPEYQEKLVEVRVAEKVLRYIHGSMDAAGWPLT